MDLFAKKPEARVKEEAGQSNKYKRTLGPLRLVLLGVGGIIGAGIFTLTGVAAANHAGPALIVSFVFAAIGCGFAGLCYSEFASKVRASGSAYIYAYVTLGELIAWMIGWDLVLEYAVGAATVSIGWSQTLVALLHQMGVHLPPQLVASPFQPVQLADGVVIQGVINLPALFIVVLISLLLMAGGEESTLVNNILVGVKVAIVLTFIGLGWRYINPSNHVPFVPPNTGEFGHFGWSGILSGAGIIFFAYIGFDAVSTAGQEAKDPQRSLPIGILGSLVVCTVLFILYAYVLTGIVNYRELNVAAPLSLALDRIPIAWLGPVMNVAVIAGLTSVILVMLFGQSRVFQSMANDGLLPALFAEVHKTRKTPWRCNLVFMVFVGLFAAFAPISVVGSMTSIGTLFAFVVVCAGILRWRQMERMNPRPARAEAASSDEGPSFKTPLGRLLPVLGILTNLGLMLGLGWANWLRLAVWLGIGLLIYFGYSRHHSKVQGELRARPAKAQASG